MIEILTYVLKKSFGYSSYLYCIDPKDISFWVNATYLICARRSAYSYHFEQQSIVLQLDHQGPVYFSFVPSWPPG